VTRSLVSRGLSALVLFVAASSCDASQAFEMPEWTLSRMLEQPKYLPYGPSAFWPDGKAMRRPPAGAVSREDVVGSEALLEGTSGGNDVTEFPVPVTRELMAEGRREFDVVCAACHGLRGDGVSVVATKMQLRAPPSLLNADIRSFPPGRIFRVITTGYGLMMSFRAELSVRERWAVVVYVEALQLSQSVHVVSLPPDDRRALSQVAP
jgi:mono/diheme cytochrome c family protein